MIQLNSKNRYFYSRTKFGSAEILALLKSGDGMVETSGADAVVSLATSCDSSHDRDSRLDAGQLGPTDSDLPFPPSDRADLLSPTFSSDW